MDNISVIYYDLIEIPGEIRSVVNINRFGELFYKKQKLAGFHKAIFRANQLYDFTHIRSIKDLEQFIDFHSYAPSNKFIFLTSSFTIVRPDLFSDFIKRAMFVDSPLCIATFDEIKQFVISDKKQMLDFLELLKLNPSGHNALIKQNFGKVEQFMLENFYLEINTYSDFIDFLHSNFELRFFNSLQTDGLVITKRSVKKEKMLSEYKYYEFVPEPLKVYFLRPFNYKENVDDAQYSLEKLNIPDLSIQWIHFSINNKQFRILMDRIFGFVSRRETKKVGVQEAAKSMSDSYSTKLNDRLEQLKKTEIYPTIAQMVKTGTKYDSLDEIFDEYRAIYDKLSKERKSEEEKVFGHGDLCFSNILYDKRIDYMKLIDPKGCTKEDDAYIDRYYDLAKLSHSVLGLYDFINNGLFDMFFDNELKIILKIELPEDHGQFKVIFQEKLTSNRFSYKLVRLYETSLFLSMLPLHIDYPKKVMAFILTAINILDEIKALK